VKRPLLLVVLAALVLAVPAAQGIPAGHTVDLATGRVDGERILGRTVAGVTAALGRPDLRLGPHTRYRLGWGERPNFSIEVSFHQRGGRQRAWSIAFEQGPIRDRKLGDLLARSSSSLQAGILARYGTTFKLLRPYACTTGNCVGEFAPRHRGLLHLTFGSHHRLGTWLTLWQQP